MIITLYQHLVVIICTFLKGSDYIMNTKNNRRSQNTKECIKTALVSLLDAGENVDSITVTKLCNTANIHRSTFYLHYSIPKDAYEELKKEYLFNCAKYLSNLTEENEIDKTIAFLDYIKNNKDAMKLFFIYSSDNDFSESLLSQANINTHFSEFNSNQYLIKYLYAYTSNGSKAIIESWLKSDCQDNVEDIANLIIRVSQYAILGVKEKILQK